MCPIVFKGNSVYWKAVRRVFQVKCEGDSRVLEIPSVNSAFPRTDVKCRRLETPIVSVLSASETPHRIASWQMAPFVWMSTLSLSGLKCEPVAEIEMTTLMRRFVLVTFAVLAGVLVTAQNQDFSKVQMKVTKVAGNVYMLEGAGGNIGASVGDDGIVIVDDQYAPLADKIQAALKGITDKPVRFIINTHYHPDHTGGNAYFQKQAPIIAHDNVRKRLESGGGGGNGGSVHIDTKPAPHEALPILTFDHDVTVHLNGEDIRALYFPAGHTDGDSIIFFPHSNVVHMGDDFVTYGFPFIDVESGGSINGMIDAVDQVIAQLPADVK